MDGWMRGRVWGGARGGHLRGWFPLWGKGSLYRRMPLCWCCFPTKAVFPWKRVDKDVGLGTGFVGFGMGWGLRGVNVGRVGRVSWIHRILFLCDCRERFVTGQWIWKLLRLRMQCMIRDTIKVDICIMQSIMSKHEFLQENNESTAKTFLLD